MNILGIHLGHDASIALVKDGKLVGTTATERYSRNKKDLYITKEQVQMFLGEWDMWLEDIDHIALSTWTKDFAPWMSIYSPYDEKYPLGIFGSWHGETPILNHLENTPRVEETDWGYTLPDLIQRTAKPFSSGDINAPGIWKLNVKIEGIDKVYPGFFIDHHLSHAASAFYTSNFDSAAIFTADASMHHPEACSGFFIGKGNTLQQFRNPGYMWGNHYDVMTEHLGIGPGTTKAGSMMGLAAHGNIRKIGFDRWEEFTAPQANRKGDKEEHRYIDWVFGQISGRFPLVGDNIRPEIANGNPDAHQFNREWQYPFSNEESTSQEAMDIAATIQYITERSLVKYTQDLYDETKDWNDGNLCVSGGTFLNCNANYKVHTETSFDRMHMFPACGDDGTAAGSALFVLHWWFKHPRQQYDTKELAYTGITHETDFEDGKPLDLDYVADALADDKIVCWFDGKSENGPRALGHRSFLASPRNNDMKDTLNARVKFREWYRPFAPIVLKEKAAEWFRMDFESPYMLHTVPCKRPFDIPAAVHIDNTARVQTLTQEHNPKLYKLIEKFEERTGIPIVINTSLNVKGQPIVETPPDVVKLFNESDVDVLVINNQMWTKDAEEER
tara:strand:+ start:5734 stop:7578 length:1845 start_codon:yes stop_codon:yes gene_type:complete